MLITLYGIDGAGKTTIGQRLAARLPRELSARARPVRCTFRKLVSDENEVVRFFKLMVEQADDFDGNAQNWIFAFERYRTAREELVPLLERHDVVVLDRYVHCDIAYSRARGRPESMYHTLLRHVPRPDLGILLDVPVETAMKRIGARSQPAWEFQENESLLSRARQAYLEVARESGFLVVDSDRTPEQTLARLLPRVRARVAAALAAPGAGGASIRALE